MKNFGKKLFLVVFVFVLFFSIAGQVSAISGWAQKKDSGSGAWIPVASSSDGVKLITAAFGGYIYTSTDSGTTWTEQTNSGQRNWQGVASSSDGVKLVAVSAGGYIYTSTDSGTTWTEQTNSGQKPWYSVASSSDGVKLVAVTSNSYIYTSTDSGATWTERTNSGQRTWQGVASSSDGVKLVAVDGGVTGYIYTSTDSGATWTEQTNSGQLYWKSVASSSDGVKLVATAVSNHIYTSTDSGATWTERTNSGQRNWSSVASSSDGVKLIAGVDGGLIYISTDSGATWTSQVDPPSTSWYGVASSSTGEKLVSVSTSGYIYIYGILTAPTIGVSSASLVGATYATLNANITDTGDRTVTTRGFEYGLTTSYGTPTSESGTFTTGSFSSSPILNLTCGTTYNYRAYATSTAGTSYSGNNTFTTVDCSQPIPEVVTTGAASAGLVHSVLNATITNVDSGNATEAGFQYGLTSSYGTNEIMYNDFGLGDYSAIIAPLTCGTTYHYRAYINSPSGVGYGDDATFTTDTCPVIESNQILYAVDGSGSNNTPTLYKLDPESGSKIETIGQVGFNVTGLAFHPITGVLYGSTGGTGNSIRSLITINTTTGLGTLLGAIKTSGNSARIMPDISFKSDGTLYGFSGTDDSLHIIDISSCNGTTCTTSQVGNTNLDGYGNGLAFNNSDELYVFWDGDNSFDQLNPNTGLSIGSTNFSNPSGENYAISSAAFNDSDVLYASRINQGNEPSDLITINVITGEITSLVGNNIDMIYIDAMDFYTAPVVSPTVATTSSTSISNSSVVLTGDITRGGYAANTVRGFEYGLTTSYGSVVSETGTLRIGSYSLTATGLTWGTTYNFRAYSTNTAGTGTGSDDTFTTSACPSSRSSTSASARATNLINMGKVQEAQEIINQFPNVVNEISNTNNNTLNKELNNKKATERKGSKSNSVKEIQTKLKVKVDGIFGPITEKAVKDFQNQNSLKVDGIVGPQTWGVLDKVL